MRILNIYVTKGILTILLSAIGILTFGMLGGNILQSLRFLAQGVPFSDFFMFLVYITPMMLTYTLPWGILISVLLFFGRMSANNEVTAMRACGISVFEIVTPVILLTFSISLLCMYFNCAVGPVYYFRGIRLLDDVVVTHPDALITPRKAVDFGNMVVSVKSKEGKKIGNVQIFTFTPDRKTVKQDITAATGKIVVNSEEQKMDIILYNYNIIDYQENNRISGKELDVKLDIGKSIKNRPLTNDANKISFWEVVGRINLYTQIGLDTTELEIELNKRLAMSLSPIAFLLLGLPLAIRTSRRETSAGLFISVILAGFYFFFLIGCTSFTKTPELHPQLLMWIPNILYQLGGLYFLNKIVGR